MHAQGPTNNELLTAAGAARDLGTNTNNVASKMSAVSFSAMQAQAVENGSNMATEKSGTGTASRYAVLNIEFRTPASRRAVFSDLRKSSIPDTFVLTAFDRFADIFVRTDANAAWAALQANPNILRVEHETNVIAPPPPTVAPSELVTAAVPEAIVRGGYKGLTGKNVVIAVLDTGIDFRHPDFITYDGQGRPASRISHLWDTATEYRTGRGSVAPFKYPNGTSIGTLYTKDQLTAELRTSGNTIPATDEDGHGTACASVAAGNGNADKKDGGLKRKEVEGVAPEAEIIGVRLGEVGLENGYLLNAICEWLDKVAGAKPLVLSGSFGGHYTGHDGQSVSERQLNARFPLTKAGRAIVLAAGNEGSDAIHAKTNIGKEAKLVSWVANRQTDIKIYFNSNDRNIRLVGSKATPLALGKNYWVELNPITNQYAVTLTVNPGLGGVWFENPASSTSEAHLYFMDSALGTFSPSNTVYGYLVGAPGSTENAITVGSYDWNDNFHAGGRVINLPSVCPGSDGKPVPFEIGWLSCYSSPGPNRNGLVKPEIASPGEWYASSNARHNGVSVGDWARPDSTGLYRRMNGTSAATPYTSGIIALMFQKKPTLTLGDIKNLLKSEATKAGLNPFRQAIPNSNWGYGKLDMAAIDRIFGSIQ
jgi:subtilisin family serine protease